MNKPALAIYISGPISADPDFVKKFALAERLLRPYAGHGVVFNPAAHQDLPSEGKNGNELWADYLCRDIAVLMEIHQEYISRLFISLPGWTGSKGACLERRFAEELGFRFLDIRTLIPDWDRLLAEELGGKK